MDKLTIQSNVCIEPKCLNNQILSHIKNKLLKDLLGTCDQEYGYVTKIYPEITVLNNIVSLAGNGIYFKVSLNIDSLKPKIGSIFEGKITNISPLAIFVEVECKMKVIVPAIKMLDYKYSKLKKIYEKGNDTLKLSRTVKVCITAFKYEKKMFDCIGTLIC